MHKRGRSPLSATISTFSSQTALLRRNRRIQLTIPQPVTKFLVVCGATCITFYRGSVPQIGFWLPQSGDRSDRGRRYHRIKASFEQFFGKGSWGIDDLIQDSSMFIAPYRVFISIRQRTVQLTVLLCLYH